VTFKVDPAGLRVLNGFDANGQFHSTPPPSLRPRKGTSIAASGCERTHTRDGADKSAAGEAGGVRDGRARGMSHQTTAVSFTLSFDNFLAYVLDAATED